MSVFALGGAGAIGSECVRQLLGAPDIDHVTIGELDFEKAEALVAELDDPRVRALRVDVRDVETTAKAVAGHQVLFNALFWESFDDALSVACAAGSDYGDLLSHPSPRHREQARTAGISAISGLGASPGVANVLAGKACRGFENPLSLEISCTSFRSVAPSEGLLDTLVELASPGLPSRGYFFHGEFIASEPLEGSKIVEFDPPVGPQMVYYINHSEATSFPMHFPTLEYVAVRGTYRPKLHEDMKVLAAYGLLDDRQMPGEVGGISVRRSTRDRIWEALGGIDDDESHHLFLHVEASGASADKHGRSIYRVAHPLDWGRAAIPRMTGIGAAVGLLMIGRQGHTQVGLLDPEQYFDADGFLAELVTHEGISITEETSWD